MPDINTVTLGDNLELLRDTPGKSADLCYLDPPFNTGRDFGEYSDKFSLSDEDTEWLKSAGPDVSLVMRGIGVQAGYNMMSYAIFMYQRLVEIHRVLKPTGSLYLHCDPNADDILRSVCDLIFGRDNFCNQIIWSYRRWPSKMRHFQRMHDVILRYSKGDEVTWNQPYEPSAEATLRGHGNLKQSKIRMPDGKLKVLPKTEESKGLPMRSVWEMSVLSPSAKERTGYPTQKPLALLRRIIVASSNEGDVVLDPFCGSGTTLVAAKELGRQYIGFDSNVGAIDDATQRLAAVEPTLNFNKEE